ncbi:MAG: T9SS type A sorting domain-containing protein [Janthinobacterium lividum]
MPYFFSYLASRWPWALRGPNPPFRLAYVAAAWLVLLAVPSGQLWAQTSCTQTSTLGYYEANSTNTAVIEKRAATENVLATSFTYGGYSSTATITDLFRLSSEQQGTNLDGRLLVWREQNAGTPGTNNAEVDQTSPFNAKVTLTFSRPVTNLTFVFQDIDRSINGNGGSNFTDEVNFYALNGSTQVRLAGTDIGYGPGATPGTGTPSVNKFVLGTNFDNVTQDAVQGTALNGGMGNNPSRAGNVTVRFASPVTTVRLTFRNLNSRSDVVSNGSPIRLQTVGIEQISWCSRADLTTSISTPTSSTSSVTAGTTGTFNVSFSNVGDLTTDATTARVQLPTGLLNVSATNGGTYSSTTGYVTYPNTTAQAYGSAAVTSAITFTAPATGPVSATATITSATAETPTPSPDPNPNTDMASIAVTPVVLTGYVFEDVNYGGGAGRPRTASGASVRSGATVELYSSTGAFIASTTTDASGQYAFNAPAAGASYTVRVVNSTVTSSRTGYTSSLIPVQTYNGTTTRVGGENPAYTDALANTGTQTLANLTSGTVTPESIATTSIAQGASTSTGPDFGFNFDLVVNTSNAGQGSLRQFISNANALGGEAALAQSGSRVDATGTTQTLPASKETSIFMIPDGAAHAGLLASANGGPASQLTNGVALISAASTLTLSGANAANTIIDGTTQTANIGNTNSGTATNTSTRTVGTDALSLAALQKPEVELVGANLGSVLDLEAASSTVRGLAVHGSNTNGQDILVGGSTASTGYVLENLLVGTAADGTRPGSNTTSNFGIFLAPNAGVGTIQNSLVGFTGNSGINVANGTGVAGTTQITSNFFTKNGYVSSGGDGITLGDKALAGPVNIAGNSFSFTNSSGVQFEIGSTSASTVTNNTVDNAGNINDAGAANSNLEGSAIDYLQRDGSKRGTQADVISKNVITNTAASGIVIGYGQQNVTLSQNSIYNSGTSAANGSGKVGIDLIGSNQSVNSNNGVYGMGDGVTLNDGNAPATATADLANRGVDFPVITSAVVTGGNLVVSGYSRPGAVIELFSPGSPSNGTNFGEGQTYLGTVTEGATTGIVDNDTGTGSYTGTQPDGLNEGTDTGASRFSFTIPLTGKFAGYTFNSLLSSTATLNNSTSEFSGIVRATTPPVPNDVTNVSIPNNTTTPVALSLGLSGTAYGNTANVTTTTATAIASYTVSLPSSGTLYYNNVALTGPTTVAANNLANLKFVPAYGSTGSATFTYTATDTDALTSTQHSTGGTISNGAATYTIPLTPSADVTTALAGPTQVNAGQPVTYTATFTNNGAQTANGVTRVIALPNGATLSSTQIAALPTGAAYNSGTNTITYSALTTLASGSSSAVSFTFTAPTAVGAATLTSTVGTNGTPNQGANNAPDVATLTLNVTEVANISATVTAATTPVAAGGTGTFNVVFKNAGPQTANGTTFTVQLPTGLSGVSVTNTSGAVIGSYTSTTGIVTLTSPPTSLAPAGQAALNVSFTMPATGLPVTAVATSTTTTSEAGQTADNVASATITSSPAFDLTTSLTGPTSVMTGNTGTLYVTTTNNGPSAASGVVQTVNVGTGLSTANLFISNGGTYNSNTGVVTFPTLATLPSGQTVGNTISFVIPAASVTFEPTATVTPNTTGAGETNTANNTARLNGAAANTAAAQVTTTAATGATVNVYTTISSTSQLVTPGSAIAYMVVAGNAGNPTATAADVTTSVQLLPGLTGTTLTLGGTTGTVGTGANANIYSYTFNDNGGTSRTATYNSTTGLVSISTITALASGSSRSFALVMTPPASVIGNGGQVLATSSVMTNLPDAMPADNLDAVRVLVSPVADLATVVTGPTSTVAGLPVTYGITFSNAGPSLGTSVVETAQLPRNLTSVTILDNTGAAVSGASYSAATGLVTFPTQASLAAGASQAYTVSFAAPNTTSYPVSAAISGSTVDGNTANNSSSVTTTTSALADVTVAVSGPASAVVGNPVTYNVTTTNNGPSAAASVTTTLQLPSGVAQANVLAAPAGTTYAVSGGIITATFTSVSSLASSASVGNYLTFTMPNATAAPATGIATVATSTTESNAGNNQQAVQTDLAPATTTTADLGTTIAYNGNPATVTVGTSLTLNATFVNNSTAAVGSVVPRIYLPAGLSLTSITSDAALGTGTYDSNTGVVTFAPITMAAGASLNSTIVLPAPASGPVVATSSITSNTTDPTPANNVASATVAITAAYDEVTTISGPASALPASTAVYTVQTSNNGPTASTSAVTQTVTLPSGVTVVAGSISGGGTVSGSTITWTIPAGQAAGATGIVTNTFAVITPALATTTFTLNASVTAPGESNTGNNTASTTTTRTNQPPVALNVTNLLQSPQSNTAGPLLISPLAANDPQASTLTYKLTSLPTASSQGVLSYNDGTANGAYTTITTTNYATLSLSAAQIATLKFDPVSNYVGNVFFTYTATDALALTSNEALYTIRVGQDNNSTYAVAPAKGGSTVYQNADVLATAFDWNGGRYTSTGTISATNGVGSVTLTSGPVPAGTTLYTVPTTVGGITYSAGQVVVTDRTKLVAGSYPITVQTVDADGGVNTVSFTIVIGAYPLPVVLTEFTATAVANRDALLKWATASEKNNDHFDIERSFDGTSFTKIGQLAGHGTTTVASAYTLTDANVASKATGPVYYRLRQVDLDGTATYSPVRTVSFTSVSGPVALSLYPNPAQNNTTLELSQLPATGTYQVLLLDATGRTVRSATLGGGLPQPLDISDLATGSYHVLVTGQLADGSAFKQSLRLTKE